MNPADETARVIGIHDGAREVGYSTALTDVAHAIAELARMARINGGTSEGYAIALNEVLGRIERLQAEKRKP